MFLNDDVNAFLFVVYNTKKKSEKAKTDLYMLFFSF